MMPTREIKGYHAAHAGKDIPMTADAIDTASLLRRNLLFGRLDETQRAAVARQLVPMSVPGGNALFKRGEPADALYVLKSGSLGAYRVPEAGGEPQLLNMVGSGETIGAFAMLVQQPRTFDLRALRDSELLRLPREGFDALIREHPQAILGAVQPALARLVAESANPPELRPRTFAVLPFDRHVGARRMAEDLRQALQSMGQCHIIDAESGKGRESGWFAQREHEARFVLYLDEGVDPAWRELCRRQADALLLAVNTGRRAEAWPDHAELDAHAARERPRYLLLEHPDDHVVPGAAQRWAQAFARAPRQHHVRAANRQRDLARLARLLTRQSTGLVLSGGGARGFAAIGMVRALREADIEIDAVGGTSIGAILGAGVALEWDDDQMYANFRAAFVDGHPLADRTVPLVALSRGRRSTELLQQAFGDVDIEDTPLAFYCVMSNLTEGKADVRRDGRVWYWLRASSAIPGILPPVLHNGHVYVDGAVINNMPTDVMHDMGVGRVLACDISADDALVPHLEEHYLPGAWRVFQQVRNGKRPGVLPLLLRTGMINTEMASAHRHELADAVVTPPVDDIGLLEWSAFDRAVDAGYQQTLRCLDAGLWPEGARRLADASTMRP